MDVVLRDISGLSYNYPDSSLRMLHRMANITAKNDESYGQLYKIYRLSGRILLGWSRNDSALVHFLKAAKYAQLVGDANMLVEVDGDMLGYHTEVSDFAHAHDYSLHLRKQVDHISDSVVRMYVLGRIGEYFMMRDYIEDDSIAIDSAIPYFQQALEIAHQIDNKDFIVNFSQGIAICYEQDEMLDEAEIYYRKAHEFLLELQDSMDIGNNLTNIGNLEEQRGNYEAALELYHQAFSYYATNKSRIPQTMHYAISDAYAGIGEFEKALTHFKRATKISDSLFYDDQDRIIEELMMKYETEKLEMEVEDKKVRLQNEQVKSRIRKVTIISLIIILAFILVIIFFLVRSHRLRETIYQKEVEIKSQEVNKLLKDQELKSYAAMLEGQDKERQRIGNDLHDRIGGLLSTVKVYFQTLEDKINRLEETTVNQYNKAGELLNNAVNEVRQISHDLSSGVLKNFGLAVALNDLKQTIELTGELEVNLYFSGEKHALDARVEMEIYHIIQEMFSNVLKHADAKKVDLQFNYQKHQLNIIFEDDGKGFDETTQKEGIGLQNIRARVSKLNGELNIDSLANRGSIFIIDIPLS